MIHKLTCHENLTEQKKTLFIDSVTSPIGPVININLYIDFEIGTGKVQDLSGG